jgi:endoglucanase
MKHFVRDDHMSIFRLPVAWQFLQPSPGANLNQSAVGEYDQLVQACLPTGAYCIIDISDVIS